MEQEEASEREDGDCVEASEESDESEALGISDVD